MDLSMIIKLRHLFSDKLFNVEILKLTSSVKTNIYYFAGTVGLKYGNLLKGIYALIKRNYKIVSAVWLIAIMVYKLVFLLDYINWSLYMKMMVGNGVKRYLDCVVQNVPGWTRVTDLQVIIDTICWKYKPMVIGLAEIDSSKVELCSYPGFSYIKGTLTNSINPRMSMLIQEKISYDVINLLCDVPNCTIKGLETT